MWVLDLPLADGGGDGESRLQPHALRALDVGRRAELLPGVRRAQPAEKLDAEVRKREAKWLRGAREHHAQQVPQKLREDLRVVLGDAPDDPFAALIATAEAVVPPALASRPRRRAGASSASRRWWRAVEGGGRGVFVLGRGAQVLLHGHPARVAIPVEPPSATALHNSTEKPYFHAVFGAGLTQEGDIDRLTGAAAS